MVHGGKLAARALKQMGVDCIFTLCGGHVMAIYDGALDEDIRVIDVRHEQAAVHAADSYSRLNPGKIGCAVLTAGPGVTDGVTGVANAWRANSPVLVIGGQGPFRHQRRGSLQEMDHLSVMRPITKWADACYDTKRIPEYIGLAVQHAVSGAPGPSFLEIPMDVLMGQASFEEVWFPDTCATQPAMTPPRQDLLAALEILATASRPVLMAGTGVKWSNGSKALNRFIEETRLPTFCNGMGRGQVRSDHPQFFNRVRKEAIGKCDVFVLAGSPLDFRLKFGRSIPEDARIIQLDMENTLIGVNRSPSAAIVGNLGLAFEQMLQVMKEESIQMDFTTWRDELRARETELEEGFAAQVNSDESPVDPMRFAREIRDFIDEDTILIGDGGDIVAQSSKVIPVYKENCWMDPGPLGTLGVGMPFALAAKISFPDKKVLIIYGDGSFGLNGFEYDTAVRFGLPIVGIMGNDAAWGQMMRPQVGLYGSERKVAVELNPTRYDKVVEALGGHGEFCERPEEIRPALERAFASGKPALINVSIRKDEGAPKGSTYV
jgi:acetolactate synthase-1/2/3 large subunit